MLCNVCHVDLNGVMCCIASYHICYSKIKTSSNENLLEWLFHPVLQQLISFSLQTHVLRVHKMYTNAATH